MQAGTVGTNWFRIVTGCHSQLTVYYQKEIHRFRGKFTVKTLCLATFSTHCTHLATQLSSITTATTGQITIGSGMQSDFLTMGIKMPETC